MAFALNKIFTPITAVPKGVGIREIAPHPSLSSYVRCFWVNEGVPLDRATRIIPDCCCDVIIPVNRNECGELCGVSNRSFISQNAEYLFGIRFYSWAIRAFCNVSAEKLFNGSMPAKDLFERYDEFEKSVKSAQTTALRVRLSEKYLLKTLRLNTENTDVMNCLYYAVKNNASVKFSDLSSYCAASMRTIERSFLKTMGVSPKKAMDSVRYQLLWQDCVLDNFDALDCVEKYGYFDQAHMYNDFKKFHGIGIADARREYKNLSFFYNTL